MAALLLLAGLALAHSEPSCSRLDGSCVGSEPTELFQKTLHPASLSAGDDSEEELPGIREEAAKLVAELAPYHAAAIKPLTELADSEEMKQLMRDIPTMRTSIPVTAGSAMDIDVAEIQKDVRLALQNMANFPTPQEALPMVVQALNPEGGNLSMPRGMYLTMAENLAMAKHHVTQNTELQDMVVSIIPAMARVAQQHSLFESLEASSDLAEKGKFFPKGNLGSDGYRDVMSRTPDMMRQTVKAVKFLQPALDHVINSTSFSKVPRDYCDTADAKRLQRWIKAWEADEGKFKTCMSGHSKVCFDIDPEYQMGSFFLAELSPKTKQDYDGSDTAAGLYIDVGVGLFGALSGSSYRKWRKLTYLMAKRARTSEVLKGLQTSLMMMGLGIYVEWKGKYRTGKDLSLYTELDFSFKNPQRQQAPLAGLGVMLQYGDEKKARTFEVQPNTKKWAGSWFNYAAWGSTINNRILGETNVNLYSSNPFSAKTRHYGGVHPKVGVVLGDLQWSSTWPVQLASNWWWKSKWDIAPSRKFAGLASGVNIPFLSDCVTKNKAKEEAVSAKARGIQELQWEVNDLLAVQDTVKQRMDAEKAADMQSGAKVKTRSAEEAGRLIDLQKLYQDLEMKIDVLLDKIEEVTGREKKEQLPPLGQARGDQFKIPFVDILGDVFKTVEQALDPKKKLEVPGLDQIEQRLKEFVPFSGKTDDELVSIDKLLEALEKLPAEIPIVGAAAKPVLGEAAKAAKDGQKVADSVLKVSEIMKQAKEMRKNIEKTAKENTEKRLNEMKKVLSPEFKIGQEDFLNGKGINKLLDQLTKEQEALTKKANDNFKELDRSDELKALDPDLLTKKVDILRMKDELKKVQERMRNSLQIDAKGILGELKELNGAVDGLSLPDLANVQTRNEVDIGNFQGSIREAIKGITEGKILPVAKPEKVRDGILKAVPGLDLTKVEEALKGDPGKVEEALFKLLPDVTQLQNDLDALKNDNEVEDAEKALKDLTKKFMGADADKLIKELEAGPIKVKDKIEAMLQTKLDEAKKSRDQITETLKEFKDQNAGTVTKRLEKILTDLDNLKKNFVDNSPFLAEVDWLIPQAEIDELQKEFDDAFATAKYNPFKVKPETALKNLNNKLEGLLKKDPFDKNAARIREEIQLAFQAGSNQEEVWKILEKNLKSPVKRLVPQAEMGQLKEQVDKAFAKWKINSLQVKPKEALKKLTENQEFKDLLNKDPLKENAERIKEEINRAFQAGSNQQEVWKKIIENLQDPVESSVQQVESSVQQDEKSFSGLPDLKDLRRRGTKKSNKALEQTATEIEKVGNTQAIRPNAPIDTAIDKASSTVNGGAKPINKDTGADIPKQATKVRKTSSKALKDSMQESNIQEVGKDVLDSNFDPNRVKVASKSKTTSSGTIEKVLSPVDQKERDEAQKVVNPSIPKEVIKEEDTLEENPVNPPEEDNPLKQGD